MRSPNFNQVRRSESISLSKEPNLDEIVDHVIERLVPLPEPGSLEAYTTLDQIKPLFYAAIAQVIDQIIDFEAPALPRHQPEVLNTWPVQLGLRKGPDLLGSFLKHKFHQQIDNYLESGIDSVQFRTLQQIIDLNNQLGPRDWNEASGAIRGGIDTMIEQSILCFRSYFELAQQQENERDFDEIKETMKRSSLDLSNATLLNPVQLAAITLYVGTGNIPKSLYDPERDQYRFEQDLDQIKLTDEIKQKLIENLKIFNQLDLIPITEKATTIAELEHSTDTLGCPIGFRPRQVQKIWDQVVGQAEAIGLL